MKYAPLLLLALGGCATSAAGLAETGVKLTVPSPKTTEAFARCVAEALNAKAQIRNEGIHYWVVRYNTLGMAGSRWDFRPSGTGSIAELRAAINVNAGGDKVRSCAS